MLIEQFRERLRHARTKNDFSQENMADMLNMSLTGYANIERGISEPNLSKVEEIAEVLKMDIGILLGIGNSNYFSHSGTHYVGGTNNGPVNFQFDQIVMEGLLAKMNAYEKEISELKTKLDNLG